MSKFYLKTLILYSLLIRLVLFSFVTDPFTLVTSIGTRHVIQWNLSVKNLTTIISSGDIVVWNWTDSVEMSVQSASAKYNFQSSPVISRAGAEYEVTFSNPGNHPYRCSIHPLLGGVIQVTSPTSQPTMSPTTTSTIRFPPIRYPTIISSAVANPKNWNLNLYVRESRVHVGPFSFNSRVFCLQLASGCMYPGPTIRVRPGDNVTIYLTNHLKGDAEAAGGVNNTNLYFHGLRLSPNTTSYFTQVAPQETASIVVSIQPNHAPGIHWYRSQNHGFNALHVLNGLIGAVIVEPEATVTRLNYPLSLKNADMVLMVITKFVLGQELVEGLVSQSCGPDHGCDSNTQAPLCSGTEGSSPFNSYRQSSLHELNAQAGGNFDINFQLNASYNGPDITDSMDLVNGQYQPTVPITQGSPIIFRVVHATGGSPLRLSLAEDAACVMTVLAWDGIYLRSRLILSLITIPAGGRCEIEVKCLELDQIPLYNQENNNQVLLYLRVQALTQGGIIRKNVKDEHLAEITRPTYLPDTIARVPNQAFTVNFDQTGRNLTSCRYWMGSGESCSSSSNNSSQEGGGEEQCQYDFYQGSLGTNKWNFITDKRFVTFEGSLVEVTLYGQGIDQLPFHIQSSVFQIVSSSSSDDLSSFFQVGSWRDTLPPLVDNITVRFIAIGSAGESVFGTSFLSQQDRGMLSSFLILNFADFQSLTVPPTSAPSVTPDDDLIGPLGTMWIIIIVAGVVTIGGAAAAYLTFFTKDRVYIVPKTDF